MTAARGRAETLRVMTRAILALLALLPTLVASLLLRQ
jgi:hypothetical protein